MPSASPRELDFLSIGTNDLAQYTMAAERGNEHVAALAAGPVPALLRLVDLTVRGAQAHGRWVGVCGELAGDVDGARLLAGLGVSELSMAPPRIADVKQTLRELDLGARPRRSPARPRRRLAGRGTSDLVGALVTTTSRIARS